LAGGKGGPEKDRLGKMMGIGWKTWCVGTIYDKIEKYSIGKNERKK